MLVSVLPDELPARSRESRDDDRERLSGVAYTARLIAEVSVDPWTTRQ